MTPIAALLLVLAARTPDLATQEPAAQAERWVIRFADGRVQRVLARPTDVGFEVRRERGWEPVAKREIARAATESELLADHRRRLGEAGEDPVRRVDVARWALGEGLLEEAIAGLDAVLETDPDLAAARELVSRAPLALTLPAPEERSLATRLVLFGARAKPAYRELAASRLAGLPREEALAELARGLPSPSPSVRAFAAFALRRVDPRPRADLASALVRRTVIDPTERVRREAAGALRDAKDEGLALRVAVALENEDGRLRAYAAEALGEMGYRAAVPALATRLSAAQSGTHPGGTRGHIRVGSQVAYVQDFNLEIAQGASIADPIVNVVEDATQLDVRVGGTSAQRVWVEVERSALCRSLRRLTGEKLPEEPGAWLSWWKENAARYAEPPRESSVPPASGG